MAELSTQPLETPQICNEIQVSSEIVHGKCRSLPSYTPQLSPSHEWVLSFFTTYALLSPASVHNSSFFSIRGHTSPFYWHPNIKLFCIKSPPYRFVGSKDFKNTKLSSFCLQIINHQQKKQDRLEDVNTPALVSFAFTLAECLRQLALKEKWFLWPCFGGFSPKRAVIFVLGLWQVSIRGVGGNGERVTKPLSSQAGEKRGGNGLGETVSSQGTPLVS